MNIPDKIAVANERLWEEEVKKGCGYTIPWLDLNADLIRQYANGQLDGPVPFPLFEIYPSDVLSQAKGKDVLCLAAGGGQQSAVFGLLDAQVTVVDIAEGQVNGDRIAADHYGYKITAVKGDMRDVSFLEDDSFDLVYGTAMPYIPDVRQVYSGVARVLRTGGIYRVDFNNPAVQCVNWNGNAYCISKPYNETNDPQENGAIETRHYLSDIFNGLIDFGFTIIWVSEFHYYKMKGSEAPPGDYNHMRKYIGSKFVMWQRKLDKWKHFLSQK